jgi:hypothetical protein
VCCLSATGKRHIVLSFITFIFFNYIRLLYLFKKTIDII